MSVHKEHMPSDIGAPLQNNFIYTKTQTTKIFVIQTTNYP